MVNRAGGEALPLAPDPLSARTLRALDPGSWHPWWPLFCSLIPGNRWRRGVPEKKKTPCPRGWRRQSTGEPGSPARSGISESQRKWVQGPQGPGG
ncbi:Hypothetical protein RMHFA_05708 [Roseomonas mucosa]|nr:Hypothetical protein RMHFA_05708 [Roseomonas mucosa]